MICPRLPVRGTQTGEERSDAAIPGLSRLPRLPADSLATTGKMIRVQLVDDHAVVRAGFKRLLEDEEDIEVVIESDCGEAAMLDYEQYRPDVTIMDLTMPGMGGLEATRRIRIKYPDARILALSFHNNTTISSRVMKAGAMGYLSKGSNPALLIEAVRQLMQGNTYIEPDIAKKIAAENVSGETSLLDRLTIRELEIFLMLAEGQSVADIARTLYLSPNTVGNHQNSIMRKLDISNKAELARLAMQENMI